MDTKDNNIARTPDVGDLTTGKVEQQSSVSNDLPDSQHDKERLKTEETILDLPDVSDIPGQENIQPLSFGELADNTISSDDEEGADVFDDNDDDSDINEDGSIEMVMGTKADVNANERKALDDDTYLPTNDENRLRRATMDNTDFLGDGLNEGGFGAGEEESAEDLDVPGRTDETTTTSLGQGDEENKEYSLGSADNDNVVEGTP